MTCLALGLCVLASVLDLPEPPPIPVHVVKTEVVSASPEPVYPCGAP